VPQWAWFLIFALVFLFLLFLLSRTSNADFETAREREETECFDAVDRAIKVEQ
jgi:hypothetical protein